MRGPRGAPYESPPLAFAMAATLDILERLDCRCIDLAASVDSDGLLFINVHPRTILAHEEFWAAIGAFGTSARRPENVVFEVVGHSPARENDLHRALTELRALGFHIAVDDLGEGSAGLRRLVEFAPTVSSSMGSIAIAGAARSCSRWRSSPTTSRRGFSPRGWAGGGARGAARPRHRARPGMAVRQAAGGDRMTTTTLEPREIAPTQTVWVFVQERSSHGSAEN